MPDFIRAIKNHLVTEVPERLGFCEFDCPKYECSECPKKPQDELAAFQASTDGKPASEPAQGSWGAESTLKAKGDRT